MIWSVLIVAAATVWCVVWVHRRDREWRSVEAHRRYVERLRGMERGSSR